MKSGQSNSRGKWVAIIVLTGGVLAALAEWKFRTEDPVREPTPATAPASQAS
jgi:hypothetical protein